MSLLNEGISWKLNDNVNQLNQGYLYIVYDVTDFSHHLILGSSVPGVNFYSV